VNCIPITVDIPAADTGVVLTIKPVDFPPDFHPVSPVFQPSYFFEIDMTTLDTNTEVHHLAEPITVHFVFTPPPGTNMELAQLLSFDANGHTEVVHATYTDNGDGTWTVSATITHLSPYGLYTVADGTQVPLNFLPRAFNNLPSGGW
jgi:hypothetical protein